MSFDHSISFSGTVIKQLYPDLVTFSSDSVNISLEELEASFSQGVTNIIKCLDKIWLHVSYQSN